MDNENYFKVIEEAHNAYQKAVLLDPVKAAEQLLKSYSEATGFLNQHDLELENDLKKLVAAKRIMNSLHNLTTDIDIMHNRENCDSAVDEVQRIINGE